MKKYLKRLIVLIFIITFVNVGIINVNAESNTGTGSISGGGGGQGSSTYARVLIAFGYRASLLKMSTDGSVVQVGNSHDFWQSYDTETYGLSGIKNHNNNKVAGYRTFFATKKPKQLVSGSPATGVYYDGDNDSVDTFLGDNTNYARGSFWGNTSGKETSGNYYAVNVTAKLERDYFKSTGLTLDTDANLAPLNKIFKACGYNKFSSSVKNIEAAIADDLVLQIEPIAAIGVTSQGCGSYSGCGYHETFVGTSYEIAVMQGSDKMESYGYTTYASPMIYAGKNSNDTASRITIKSGINLATSAPSQTYDNTKSSSGALGVSLFRLQDFTTVENCESDFDNDKTNILTNTNKYNAFVNKYKTSKPLILELSNDGTISGIATLARTLFGDPINGTNACKPIECTAVAEKIYDKYYNTDRTTYNRLINELDSKTKAGGHNYTNTLKYFNYISGKSKPYCDTVTVCIPQLNTDCSSGGTQTLTVADSADEDCWGKGTAYTIGRDNVTSNVVNIQKKYQKTDDSDDYTYADTGCKLRCREVVTFEFPGNTTEVKAGQVFKWGTDSSKGSNLFGKMKISMTCKVKQESGSTCLTPKYKKVACSHGGNTYKGYGSAAQAAAECSRINRAGYTSCTYTTGTYCAYRYSCGVNGRSSCCVYLPKATTNHKHRWDWTFDSWVDTPFTGPNVSNLNTNVSVEYISKIPGGDKNYTANLTTQNISSENQHSSANLRCRNAECSNVNYTAVGSYKFSYPNTFEWRSYKKDSSLVNTPDYNSRSTEEQQLYYYIGYSMPTSFKTPNGTYNNLKAIVTKVGYNNHFKKLLDNDDDGIANGFKYSCKSRIKNEYFGNECEYDASGNLTNGSPEYCDPKDDDTPQKSPKGVDVVFREVQLLASESEVGLAFPGRSGAKIRRHGKNWQLTDAEIYSILNKDVYGLTPMYQIKLDTKVITNIRYYNKKAKNASRDPYTGMTSYNTANASVNNGFVAFYCAKNSAGDKIYCASSFLSKLKESYQLSGRCIWTSNTTDRANSVVNGTSTARNCVY